MTNGFYPLNSEVKTEFYLAIDKGQIPGHRFVTVSGQNPDVNINDREDLWTPAGRIVPATAGESWEYTSTSAEDQIGGVGATEVTTIYLDDTWTEQTAVVTLTGTTPSIAGPTNMFRHLNTIVTARGSAGVNQGVVTINVAGGGAVRSGMSIGENHNLDGHYTVPAKTTSRLTFVYAQTGKNKDATIRLETTNGDNGIYFNIFPLNVYQNTILSPLPTFGDTLIEKTDFIPVVQTATNQTSVTMYMRFLEIKDGF